MTLSARASHGSPPPSHARDFGGLVHGAPARVAHPSSAREVSLAFRAAGSAGLAVAVRGAGHSQSGHTVVREGLVIDTSRLCGVTLQEGDILEVGGGQPWGGVIDALHGTGLTVPVLTDSAFPTVGGTLSAGGFGTASLRFGAQVGHVERLEVVTPAGDLVTCSREAERELFDAVRAGQGQFGVITRAWLRLRRCPSRIRYYYLRYVDMDRLADDVERLFSDPRYGHLRLELRPHVGDALFRVGIEYEPPGPSPIELFLGLRCVEVRFGADADDIGRAGLLPDDLFPTQRFYPWRDWFLPWSALRRLLARPPVPLGWLPDAPGWGGCFFISSAHMFRLGRLLLHQQRAHRCARACTAPGRPVLLLLRPSHVRATRGRARGPRPSRRCRSRDSRSRRLRLRVGRDRLRCFPLASAFRGGAPCPSRPAAARCRSCRSSSSSGASLLRVSGAPALQAGSARSETEGLRARMPACAFNSSGGSPGRERCPATRSVVQRFPAAPPGPRRGRRRCPPCGWSTAGGR